METNKQSYEVLTDNWPRRRPLSKGATVELSPAAAKYPILSGDLKPVKKPARPAKTERSDSKE